MKHYLKTLTILSIVGTLAVYVASVIPVSTVKAQQPRPALEPQQRINWQSPAPRSPMPSLGLTGAGGQTPYYYWIIANYPIGAATPAGPAIINGPGSLSGSNAIRVTWGAETGATSYSVLKNTSPTFPLTAGACAACALSASTTATALTDTGAGLAAFTLGPAIPPAIGYMYLDNRDASSPRFVIFPPIAGTVLVDLNGTPSATGTNEVVFLGTTGLTAVDRLREDPTTGNLNWDTNGSGPIDRGAHFYDVRSFGATCDGVADDTTAIQAAITAAGTGGIVYIPAGTCNISTTLTVGDGSVAGQSTVNSISLIGNGIGALDGQGTVAWGTRLVWTGAANGTMLEINGPIAGVTVQGIAFHCENSADTAMLVSHAFNSTFRSLQVRNFLAEGIILTAISNPAGVTIGANNNIWEEIDMSSVIANDNVTGIEIGADTEGTAPNLDVAKNSFNNVNIQVLGDNSAGIRLQFTDNLTFVSTGIIATGASSLAVDIATVSDNTVFPGAVWFYNFSSTATVASDPGWTGTTPIYFFPYNPDMSPSLPNDPAVCGIDTTGTFFGLCSLKPAPVAFADLGTPADGVIVYCSDCDTGGPPFPTTCASSPGTGAFAFRRSGDWICM